MLGSASNIKWNLSLLLRFSGQRIAWGIGHVARGGQGPEVAAGEQDGQLSARWSNLFRRRARLAHTPRPQPLSAIRRTSSRSFSSIRLVLCRSSGSMCCSIQILQRFLNALGGIASSSTLSP